MYKKFTEYNKENKNISKALRKNMNEEERILWFDLLKNYPVKFYRQRPIGNYITDFYCSKAKIVIELDGSQHYTEENISKDEERSRYLSSLGIKVLRFDNSDIHKHFDWVHAVIDNEILKEIQNKKDE